MRAAFNIRDPNQSVRELCFFQPAFVPLTTPAVVGEELKVAHGLGRVPIGWMVVKGDRTVAGDSLPVGTIIDLGHGTLPSGYLLCDGSNKNTADYPDLAAALGTTWGSPGAGLFTLPSFARRARVGSGGAGTGTLGNAVGNTGGAETHTLVTGEIPAHSHGVTDPGHKHRVPRELTGAATGSDEDVVPGSGASTVDTSTNTTGITIQNAGGGGAHNNVQPSAIVTMAIKYAPTQASLANTTEWTNEFIYLKFAVASAALTVGIF
ncbi:MAG: tail fiber protein [Candidatus Hydrogenedentes bacterium]|nr:tail fiber protein [Candidatus Hydrogenedentota bacterium]